MKANEEFVIVKGGPAATPGEFLMVNCGGEYIIESVEELTLYRLRKVKPTDNLISGIGLEQDEIELANMQGNTDFTGLQRDLKLKDSRKRRKDKQP